MEHSLGKDQLRMLGRGYLIRQIEEFEQHGVTAAAILPEGHGFAHMAKWAEQERVDLIVVPGK